MYHQEGTKITIQIKLNSDPVPEELLKKKQDYLRYSVGQQYVLGEFSDKKQGTGWIKYYINGKMLEPQVYGFYLEENNNDIYYDTTYNWTKCENCSRIVMNIL
jgi:hypothetical protein